MHTITRRPTEAESSTYFQKYISLVEGNDIVNILESSRKNTIDFLRSIPTDKWDYSYAPGKWTLKESWIHLIDAERVFAYRAMRVSRGDQTPLPGFDQDDYVPHYQANERSIDSIIEEFDAVRRASISLFKNLSETDFSKIGVASGSPFSVLAGAYVMAGHEQHHLNIIREKYLG